jgi:hypothetical protein
MKFTFNLKDFPQRKVPIVVSLASNEGPIALGTGLLERKGNLLFRKSTLFNGISPFQQVK